MIRSKTLIPLLFAGTVLGISSLSAASHEAVIPNHLRQSWPWDPTYFKVDPATADQLQVAEFLGHERPVQIQRTTVNGEDVTRAWFIATITEREAIVDDRGRNTTAIIADVPVTLRSGNIAPGITRTDHGDFHLIDNGVYEFRLRQSMTFDEPIPFGQVPHWSGGGRVKGEEVWDGRAWFEGTTPVRGFTTEIVEEGPVFIDVLVRYDFVTEELGTTEALPLDMGKQTYLWEPNTPAREKMTKKAHAYEVKLRFIMGTPLIEANERFHLPSDPEAGAFGIHQYWMSWGVPQDAPDLDWFDSSASMPVDTVTWVRWFLYDRFGGNVTQHYVPAEPREDQRGRPFALLRPRWNQGGGGAQDFVVTSGGQPAPGINAMIDGRDGINRQRDYRNADDETKQKVDALVAQAQESDRPFLERFELMREANALIGREIAPLAENYSEDNPASGVIALFASKWVGPYPATIATYAHDRNRASARFPLRDGERSGLHYGQRSFGLLFGPRSEFQHLNGLVRRTSDWTLVAVTNKYVTQWERDPAKAGPNVYISRKRLEELREAYESGDGVVTGIMRQQSEELEEMRARVEEITPTIARLNDERNNEELSPADQALAQNQWRELTDERNNLNRQIDSTDMVLLRMITEGYSRTINPQDAGLWLDRRYQDDFLNPTQRAPRSVVNFADADLFAGGQPVGGGLHAALGYISTDLDSWPGWQQGWSPGNPNFHTDKYMGAIYIGAALRDHPHSDEWLAYGYENFLEDLEKVLTYPDGVGAECPGYAGYALRHQLGLARIFYNTGFGNPVAENPLFRKTGIWHRHLITPFDYRLGLRHAAPIGDTHRWTSGLTHGFGALAAFFADSDPEFASEMQGTWKLLLEEGDLRIRNPLRTQLIETDPSIPAMDPHDMDWGSHQFHGFGVIMRNNFGPQESFLSIKAGPTRGHYHNDELAYHFYANGHPISLDYNCSYSPRGDHAALHNSMTFGREGRVRHNARDEMVHGMEQIFGTAWAGGFGASEEGAVFVAERESNSVTMTPIFPEDHEFSRNYESRQVDPIIHRRFTAMVKHPEGSQWNDFLVVREETQSTSAQAVNIHLVARESTVDGNLIKATGQYGMDMTIYVAEATDLEIDNERYWSYSDPWMLHPGEEYTIRPGESFADFDTRMAALKAEHGVENLPLPGWSPRWRGGRDETQPDFVSWRNLLQETNGKALMPPSGWNKTWLYGEIQHWIRLNTRPGTPVMWVLYPTDPGEEAPTFESLADGTGVRLTLNGESQEIYLATNPTEGVAGQAVLRRDGQETVLIPLDAVPALGEIERRPLEERNLAEN